MIKLCLHYCITVTRPYILNGGGIQLVRTNSGEPVAEILGGPAHWPRLYVILLRQVFEARRMHVR